MRPEPLTHEEFVKICRLMGEGLEWQEAKRLSLKLKALNELLKSLK